MNQVENILEEKCKTHSDYNSELLLLDESSLGEKVCLFCIQERDISMRKVLSIKELLKSSKDKIFISYPPLNDKNLNQTLQNVLAANSQQKIIEQVEAFYSELKKKIVQAVDKKMKLALEEANKYSDIQQHLLEAYSTITDTQTLKKLVLENNQEEVTKLLKQKIADTNKNTKIVQDIVNMIKFKSQQSKDLLDQAKLIGEQLVQSIENIQLFNNTDDLVSTSILSKVNILPSKYEDSEKYIAVNRLDNHAIQLKEIGKFNGELKYGYFDFTLDPSINYLLRAQIEQNSEENEPFFIFGIHPENSKDEFDWESYLGYIESSEDDSFIKTAKGKRLQSVTGNHVKKTLEIRIQLNSKVFKVADYPNYSSIAALNDQSKIDLTKKYRLIVGLSHQNDVIIIQDFCQVTQFDGKMD